MPTRIAPLDDTTEGQETLPLRLLSLVYATRVGHVADTSRSPATTSSLNATSVLVCAHVSF